MMEHDELVAWSVLCRAPGVDRDLLSAALELSGGAAALITAVTATTTAAGCGATLPDITRSFLRSRSARTPPHQQRWFDAAHHHLVPFTDRRYPKLLLAAPHCPLALYVAGNIDALAEPQLAIVGSRSPTAQGRETTLAFAEHLSARGLGITSGMAEGIDACAHRGALNVQGVTLGVLGTGIDVVYPRCNLRLFEEVENHGALLSEFLPGTPPRRQHFPRRNRIIAALALGTLVIEATCRSGSLITARLANAYGREVFAVPGSIHNPLSRGCHELIKDGAKLVETTDDILTELNFSAFFANDLRPAAAPVSCAPRISGMDKDRKILLDALGFDPVDLDRLVVRTGFKADAVSSMMLILELEGHVQAAPGGRYTRVVYRRGGGERQRSRSADLSLRELHER